MSTDTMRSILVVVGVIVGLLWLTSSGDRYNIASILSPALDTAETWLRALMEKVAIGVLLVGGIVYLSPKHQDLGKKLVIGAVVSLCIAEIGPPLLSWLQHVISSSVPMLLRGGT
jgi:hypothetical protein